jgi:hypothetical protein
MQNTQTTIPEQPHLPEKRSLSNTICRWLGIGLVVTIIFLILISVFSNNASAESTLTQLENGYKAKSDELKKNRNALCNTEIRIASSKLSQHYAGKKEIPDTQEIQRLVDKTQGKGLDCLGF